MYQDILNLSVSYTGYPFLRVTTSSTNTLTLEYSYTGYPWIGYSQEITNTFIPIISWIL
jgi:hypothetical protein